MNIAKLILLACPVFLASVLLVAHPVQASGIKSTPTEQITTIAALQPIPDLLKPHLATASNPIIDQLGCNCGNCVQAKFELLQGKLPSVSFS